MQTLRYCKLFHYVLQSYVVRLRANHPSNPTGFFKKALRSGLERPARADEFQQAETAVSTWAVHNFGRL